MADQIDKQYLQQLWKDLSGNFANRALVVARLAANHADPQTKAYVTGLIKTSLPDCPERRDALNLLSAIPGAAPKLFSHLQIVREGENGTTYITPIFADPSILTIRVDAELARIAAALWLASYFRLWAICRDLTRSADGSGKLSKKVLFEKLPAYGINYTREHFNRLIRRGNRLFWNTDTNTRRIFVRSSVYVSEKLVEIAEKENPLLVATNRPGTRDVYLSPAGSHEQWEAMIYIGWMTHREAPTIARSTLETLFNRDQDTLRRWEQTRLSDQLIVRTNYAQHPGAPDEWSEFIPDHARNYLATIPYRSSGATQEIRVYWRMPNTYIPRNIRQHPKRGQARKVRTAVNSILGEPTKVRRGGSHTSKRYIDTPQRLKRHIKKHGGTVYVWRGENRHGHGIFELNETGIAVTRPTERARYKQEYIFFTYLERLRKEYATQKSSS